MQIDHSFRKDTLHPPRWGYQARGNVVPSSIVIHTTSNKKPTQFVTEAVYLRDSADVSAHFLIGKDGRIVQFLDPKQWQAWHAGSALPAYLNARSVGIEHHVSLGETWTTAQHEACTWLVQGIMSTYGIALVDTHRAVALPKGRKSDPAGWNDAAFYAWRAQLATPSPSPLPALKRYRVVGLPVYQAADRHGALWGHLTEGQTVEIDDLLNGHLADGRGFVDLAGVEPL